MKYAILIYSDPALDAAANSTPALQEAEMGKWGAFTQETMQKAAFSAGEALEPTSAAKTVRVRGGKAEVTDGPFAETKEVLGGFYILDCKDTAEAIEWAKKIPSVGRGSIEVRPVVVFTGM